MPGRLDYLVDTAHRLIHDYGKTVVIHDPEDPNNYDPTTGKAPRSENAKHTIIVSPPEKYKGDKEFFRFVSLDLYQEGDCKVGVAAKNLTIELKVGQIVEIDGGQWRVIEISPEYSGELVAVYWLHLRL